MVRIMKKFIVSVLAATVLMTSGSVLAMDKSLENKLSRICEAAQSNSKYKLNFAIKKARLKYKDVVDGLVCNGEDIITFAKINGADNTAGLLLSRTGNSDKSVPIQNIAKK